MRAGAAVRVRATFADTWDLLTLPATSEESVASLKARVLEACRVPAGQHGGYEVKVGGALVRDEAASLEAAAIADGTAVVILARRRRPVR